MSKLKDSVAAFAEVEQPKLLPAAPIRTPKGIKKTLKRLARLWRAHPNLRLGELLSQPFQTDGYLGNIRLVGDGKLIELLEKYYDTD